VNWRILICAVAIVTALFETGESRAQSASTPCVLFDSKHPSVDSNGAVIDVFKPWASLPKSGIVHIALVMANDYTKDNGNPDVPVLNNPPNDARLMHDLLMDRGYTVVCLLNLSKLDMILAVQQFRTAWEGVTKPAQPKGVVYFAGHGAETQDGYAFLLPADFDQLQPGDSGMRTLALFDLLAWIPATDNPDNPPIVIIDACRTVVDGSKFYTDPNRQPFRNSVANMRDEENLPLMHIVFTTSNGQVASDGVAGKNGPFVKSLNDFLEQTPWTAPQTPWDLPPNPLVRDEVDQVSNVLRALPQSPFQPNNQEDALWIKDSEPTQSFFLWLYGRIVKESADSDPTTCLMLNGVPSLLDEVTAPNDQTWVTLARARFAAAILQFHCNEAGAFGGHLMAVAAVGAPAAMAARPAMAVDAPNVMIEDVAGPARSGASNGPTESAGGVSRKKQVADVFVVTRAKIQAAVKASATRTNARMRALRIRPRTNAALPALTNAVSAVPKPKPADAIVPDLTQNVSLTIDGTSGAVSQQDDQDLSEFLDGLVAKGIVAHHANLYLVQPSSSKHKVGSTPLSLGEFGAFLRAETIRARIAAKLSLGPDAVDLKPAIERDDAYQLPCLSREIVGLCLLITVTQ